ncbi:FUSC family protein [Nocardioides bruguierae]|uniref:Aromatic acid exporter family protein n=1 Tax=Nocardioides bruguierae TaxID=2945102 RepID=A0A9X2IEU1_9ACTN|nr:aromatic acid exporter family protein [Nocardioides bruguierae]MCM0621171.1 aromatic acid exporter family protein [Nocardioides bruguierae]
MADGTRRVRVAPLTRLLAPEHRLDLLQVVKAVLATVAAWLVATEVLGLQSAFLAPWTALLTVHATVYRSVWRGAQSVAATGLGILLSFAAAVTLGFGALPMGLAVLVGLLVARAPGLRTEGVTVATTALFLLTSGSGDEPVLLLHRFADTLVGVLVGIVVNVLVVPPLDAGTAERSLVRVSEGLGALLRRMAHDVTHGAADLGQDASREWIAETARLDADLDRAENQLVTNREARWYNPRRRRGPDPDRLEEARRGLEEAITQTRAAARVVDRSTEQAHEWDEGFRERWTRLLDGLGARLAHAEEDTHVLGSDVADEVADLVSTLSASDLPDRHWPVYGALLIAVRELAGAVDAAVGESDARPPDAGQRQTQDQESSAAQ